MTDAEQAKTDYRAALNFFKMGPNHDNALRLQKAKKNLRANIKIVVDNTKKF